MASASRTAVYVPPLNLTRITLADKRHMHQNGPDDGVVPYSSLPKSGATVHEDTSDAASYSYDSSSREFISFDTPAIAKLKAQYVQSKSLAGTFVWDVRSISGPSQVAWADVGLQLSQDKRDSNSLVDTTKGVFGSLDQTQNHLSYPNSKFANVRSNMGTGSASTATKTTSHQSTTTSQGSQPISGSGKCTGVAAWNSSTNYKPNASVMYSKFPLCPSRALCVRGLPNRPDGHLWTANDYSHNDQPGNYGTSLYHLSQHTRADAPPPQLVSGLTRASAERTALGPGGCYLERHEYLSIYDEPSRYPQCNPQVWKQAIAVMCLYG